MMVTVDQWSAAVRALVHRGLNWSAAESYTYSVLMALGVTVSPEVVQAISNKNVKRLVIFLVTEG